mmetsp:Transcript_122701/g.225019  ORF Transcript_122701/g.225019 Transcript_122701/m.225019 type:complete len:122 (-) Transcript_122701:254-619(-)
MISKHNVKNTDRVAATMPLIIIINSGRARSNLAIRAIRVKRNKRATRKIDASPVPPLPVPIHSKIIVITQVSITIMNTNAESNTNHASLKQYFLSLNDMNRTNHSKKKYEQNKFSATMKTG